MGRRDGRLVRTRSFIAPLTVSALPARAHQQVVLAAMTTLRTHHVNGAEIEATVVSRPSLSSFRVAEAERIYAIGDVHGCADLLGELLTRIRQDNDERSTRLTRLIFLGDIVDRGPNSADVVRRAMRWSNASDRVIVLKGNHEVLMSRALAGDVNALQLWLKLGGDQTLRSWNVPERLLNEGPVADLLRRARACVTSKTLSWLAERPFSYTSGSVFFVHAGVRPGVPLEHQIQDDLIHIRKPFLSSFDLHPALIVHGHTIAPTPQILPNRIGVDTGAYRSGRLTAVGLEGASVWTVQSGSPLEKAP